MESTLCADLRRDNNSQCRIIETFHVQGGRVRYADLHMARLSKAADLLAYPLDHEELHAVMDATVSKQDDAPMRGRLTLAHDGEITCEAFPLAHGAAVWRVGLCGQRLLSSDPWLQVKTTRRTLYDTVRQELPHELDEMLFLNEREELCEGTITNVFVEKNGVLWTPPARSGCLSGILRQVLLNEGRAHEAVLTMGDLKSADQLWVGNALRGLIRADLRL